MVYLISGLGADERVFQFLDLSKIDHRFIKWNEPMPNETIVSYCTRLIEQINTAASVYLIGISFGGLIAQEISKIISCKKVIIISSIKTTNEFSWQLQLVRKFQLYRFIPLGLLKLLNRLSADYYFSIQSKSESKLLHEIIRDTDDKFLAWAMHQLMTWENDSYPENLIHIHGTADRIFPIASLQPRRFLRTCEVVNEVVKVANDEAEDNGSLDGVIEIPNGGHFLIVNKASLIEGLIFELIENEENGH